MSKNRWDSDQVIKFLELLENYPCIWDGTLKDYKDRPVRDQAFASLAQDMSLAMDFEGFGLAEAKWKYMILKKTYLRIIQKMVKRNNSGSGRKFKPFTPWFATADKYLRPTVKHLFNPSAGIKTKTKNTINKVQKPKDPLSTEITIKFEENSDEEDEVEQNGNDSDTHQSTASIPVSGSKKINKTDPVSPAHSFRDLRPAESEYEIFGRNIACILEKLPENLSLEIMSHIQTYIYEQRLKLINAQQTVQSSQHFMSVNRGPASTAQVMHSSQHFMSVNGGPISTDPLNNTMAWQ